MDKKVFLEKIETKGCSYIYTNGNLTGLVNVYTYEDLIVLTWEECPIGEQYDESLYTKDEVHHFKTVEEIEVFFKKRNINYSLFSPS